MRLSTFTTCLSLFLAVSSVIPHAVARENIDYAAQKRLAASLSLSHSQRYFPDSLEEAVHSGTPDQVLGFLEQGADANGQLPGTELPYLYFCLNQGDLEKARYLLAHKANPYLENDNGTTIFDLALSKNSVVLLDFVLQHSSSNQWRQRYENVSRPVIHRLARSNQRGVLQILLKYGWNINQPNGNGNTPLMEVVRQGNVDMLHYLIENKADLYHKDKQGRDALHVAIRNKLPDALHVLLRAGLKPQHRYKKDMTALMFAITQKNLPAVELLARTGSDFNAVNAEGENALVIAMSRRYFRIDVFESILKLGINVNSLDKNGQSLLARAVYDRCYLCVDKLLAQGADVNEGGQHTTPDFDSFSWPPLFWAVEKQDTYLVEKLLKAGANIHHRLPKDRTTVLFSAIRDGTNDASLVRLLIKHGAKVNVADKDHWTLFGKAVDFHAVPVIKALIDAGVDVNKPNWHGWTPLMSAAGRGSSETTALLLKHGASVNARTRRGWTALSQAKRAGHFDVVTLLIRAGGTDPMNVQPKTRDDRGKLKVEIKVLD